MLGNTHRGLPVQLIIKVDESDLRSQAGLGTTATGALLPMSQVIELAADAQHHLAVFKDHTAVPLYFGRAKRLATQGQRLMSFARNGGETCSAPDCDQPATRVELHHAAQDFALGGKTDITDLAPACPKHNRMVADKPGYFTTRVATDGPDAGRTAWRLNSAPGAPPNPERINRRPDIAAGFHEHLRRVRTEIQRPPPSGLSRQSRPSGRSPSTPDEDDLTSSVRSGPAPDHTAPDHTAPDHTDPVLRERIRLRHIIGAGFSVTELSADMLTN